MEEQTPKLVKEKRILALTMAIGGLIIWIFSFISVDPYLRKIVQAGIGMILWLVGAQYLLRPRKYSEMSEKDKKNRFYISMIILLILITLLILFLLK